MSHNLIEIPRSEWKKLRDLYLANWPHNLVGYHTLDNYINWINLEPEINNLNVYSLDGNWNDGTFLIVDRYQLFLNTLSETNDRLKIALSLLNWQNGFKVSTFLERHRPAVIDIVESKNLKKEYDSRTPIYYLPKSEGEKIDINCPDNVILKTLNEDDAILANKVWPNRHEGSEFFIKRIAKWNPNVGAYSKDNNELMAWCLRLQAGPLGALQTHTDYMRKGLGSLVTKAMIKKLAANNQDTFACVTLSNDASKNMFEKLGFKVYDNAFWLKTFPTIDNFHWKDE